MELLKQPLYEPIPLWEQVVILAAASDGALDDMELKKLSGFRKSLMHYILGNYPEIPESITSTKEITPEQIAQIAEITAAYKEQVSVNG
jgi:F-type H+-transporting ATPase subunit alpha